MCDVDSVAGTKCFGSLDAVFVISPGAGTTVAATVAAAAGVVEFVGGHDVDASNGSSIFDVVTAGVDIVGTDTVGNIGVACVVGGCVSAPCVGGVETGVDGVVCLVGFVRVGRGVDGVEMVLTNLFALSLYN